jgi:fumarate hydratase class II
MEITDRISINKYVKKVQKLNPKISYDTAYKIAHEEFTNYKKLREAGYSDTNAKRLSASIRYGIYL